jgi:ribosomal protein S3AE
MRIKSIAITNRVVSEEIDTKIRKCISDFTEENVSKMKTEEFIREVIDGKLQQKIRKIVSKIYPLKHFEFRKTEVL